MESTTFSVYILLCSNDTYYVGVTNNLPRRLQEPERKKIQRFI